MNDAAKMAEGGKRNANIVSSSTRQKRIILSFRSSLASVLALCLVLRLKKTSNCYTLKILNFDYCGPPLNRPQSFGPK